MTKLVVAEPESAALVATLRGETLIASDLVRTELRRAVARRAPALLGDADTILARLRLVRLTPELLDAAGRVGPPELRTLDALHLQCALLLGDELAAFATYDARQAGAARQLGLRVVSPTA